MTRSIVVFNCPVHGMEFEKFCFRALDRSLGDLWVEFSLVYAGPVPTNKLEKFWLEEEARERFDRVAA